MDFLSLSFPINYEGDKICITKTLWREKIEITKSTLGVLIINTISFHKSKQK